MTDRSTNGPFEHDEPQESRSAKAFDTPIPPETLNDARQLFEVDKLTPLSYPGTVYHYLKSEAFTDDEQPSSDDETELLGSSVALIRRQLEELEGVAGGYRGDKKELYRVSSQKDNEMGDLRKSSYSLDRQFKSLGSDLGSMEEKLRLYEQLLAVQSRINELALLQSLINFLHAKKGEMVELAALVGRDLYDRNNDPTKQRESVPLIRLSDVLTKFAALNPSSFRNSLLKQLDKVTSSEFDVFVPEKKETTPETKQADLPEADVDFEILANQELDFQILPADTNLRELSKDIFAESTDTEKERVDLERIKILEDMRQLFGPERCFFARGLRNGHQYTNDFGEKIDGDFIILVMQNHDSVGSVTSEDALAISPISRRHAAFYMRQDASAGISWREVFSFSKAGAQMLGARKLKFVGTKDINPYEAVKEKVFALASCPVKEFEDDLRYNPEKKYYETRSARLRTAMARDAATNPRSDVA